MRRTRLGLCIAVTLATFSCTTRPACAATFDADSAFAKARALTPFVLRSEPGPLWGEFDATMKAALKDSASWAATLGRIATATGSRDSILREEVTSPQPGSLVYRAVGRYAKFGSPLELVFSFDAGGRINGLWVKPASDATRHEAPSQFLDYRTKTALRLPFRGAWSVVWGGRTLEQNYHAFSRDQRFAMDLLIVRSGRTHEGEGKALTDYYCYGQDVLAPAAGKVVWAQDSLPDNAPGQMDPAHATGNSLVIDHGNGEYSLLAHLQPGSLRFKVGDAVPADAVLGRCGNSGNTSEPHVHYHLQNGPVPFDADGLPAAFTALLVDGKRVERAELLKGQVVKRAE
jgi:murein DD-endopeptidase MepM/ murein hydrolase activator NlpD